MHNMKPDALLYCMASVSLVMILALTLTPQHMTDASQVHADAMPSMTISIAKDTYYYCENLTYLITVSDVTGDVATAHIIDDEQKKSQPIPILIESDQNTIRAPFPFEKSIFPTGTYTISMSYSGANASASFVLQDDGRTCIPAQVKQIAASWLSGTFSDGFLIDIIKKSVSSDMVHVPFEINQDVIYDITIPQWVKQPTYWWITGEISDQEIAGIFDYMLKTEMIYVQTHGEQQDDTGASDDYT